VAEAPEETPDQLKERFLRFRRGRTGERVFRCGLRPPYHAAGFCYCDASLPRAMWFYLKAGLARLILKLPFNSPKLWVLRRQGARIGCNVHIAVDVWIDPLFPELLEIEDDVTVGVGAKIALHEFTVDEFRAGRVMIRKGAVIGGFALIASGVEIGLRAMVAGGAVVGNDVPAGATAIGNPARVRQHSSPATEEHP
jgi:acetyltransferase-like isoleucine patch superfamily enzyme